ncbi:hypothetical protein EMIT0P253_400002 [Pseudomonas sp. IT-P253]
MNIFEALRESHDRQRSYADALIQTSGDNPERVEAYKQLKSELQAHETAEERHFYIPPMAFDNGVDLSRQAERDARRAICEGVSGSAFLSGFFAYYSGLPTK